MSLRTLYRKIPATKRICSYYRCQHPILRNIARDDSGHLYHYGCLQTARDERFRCLNCTSMFDATQAAFDVKEHFFNDELRETLRVLCPNCGGTDLKALHGGSN